MVRALLLVACLTAVAAPAAAQERTGRRPGVGAPRAPGADARPRRQQPVRRPVRRGRGPGRYPPLRDRPVPRRRRHRRRPRARPRAARGRAARRGLPPRRRVLRRHAGPRPHSHRRHGRAAAAERRPRRRGASSTLEGLNSIDGLYKLRLEHRRRPLAAKGFKVTSEDLVVSLDEGTAVSGDERRGRHGPGARRPRRHAVCADADGRARAAAHLLRTRDARTPRSRPRYIRLNPSDYRQQVVPLQLPPATIDDRA